jgi:hypothetical protein
MPGASRLTFVLECRLARRRADALFLDATGTPHEPGHFERIARASLLALLPQDDGTGAFRRRPLEDEATWARMKALGQPSLGAALPPDVARDPLRLAVVTADYTTITWWAAAMRRAGCALAEARAYLAAAGGPASPSDERLQEVRHRLERALASVVSTTAERWGEPWDVLALHLASGGRAAPRAVIVSPALTASYPAAGSRRRAPGVGDGTPGSGSSLPKPGPEGRAPERDGLPAAVVGRAGDSGFTPAERELLARHVVNLRDGALAGDGPGAATEDGVRDIFAALACRARGGRSAAPMRLVFVAHGGLVPEAEGLRSSLARIPFWRAHGLYPLFFVWHTGLAETLTAIVRAAVSGVDPRQARRGAILDALIEEALRRPGQSVWARMKRSAERANGPRGGARLVAELAGELRAGGGAVEIHAVGHSAGCVFLAHFLSALLCSPAGGAPRGRRAGPGDGGAKNGPRVESAHFIAPALTTALFASRLKRLVGPDGPIRGLTLYALRRQRELDDRVGPYGKSLLHLVSRSCEPDRPAQLLGLQECLERDVRLVRFFGLAGLPGRADALFAPTPPGASPRDRAEATTHAGFDDDPATMDTIVARMRDAGC